MKLFRISSIKSLAFAGLISLASCLNAQSDFDLTPPLQGDLKSNEVLMSPDPLAIPTFQFAVAKIEGNKLRVSTAKAQQTLVAVAPPRDPTLEYYTENATQTYTVAIPYTETLDDGTTVTKTRTETRTRSVPVTKTRKKKLSEEELAKIKADQEKAIKDGTAPAITSVETVQVPYTYSIAKRVVENGEAKTVMTTQTRMRSQNVTRGKTETTKKIEIDSLPLAKAKFYSVQGEEITAEKAGKRLADQGPVILIKDSKGIAPYFESILKPDVIFVVVE